MNTPHQTAPEATGRTNAPPGTKSFRPVSHQELVKLARYLPELKSMPKKDFIRWLADNETIYSYFESFAAEAMRSGRKRFSAYMIRERVRWYTNIEYAGDFKISNNLTPYIARLLAVQYPVLKDIFSFKDVDLPTQHNLFGE